MNIVYHASGKITAKTTCKKTKQHKAEMERNKQKLKG